MTEKIGRTRNFNDTASVNSAVALNASTSIKVVDSLSNRKVLIISNASNKEIWLKLQAAVTDNDKKGIHMPPRSYWEMSVDNIYTGEVSAIAESGTPDVYTTEY